jgi:hypothetical protein
MVLAGVRVIKGAASASEETMMPGSCSSGSLAALVLTTVADATYVNTKSGLYRLQRGNRGLGQRGYHAVNLDPGGLAVETT